MHSAGYASCMSFRPSVCLSHSGDRDGVKDHFSCFCARGITYGNTIVIFQLVTLRTNDFTEKIRHCK